jgi:hypothetical protein
VGGALFGTNPWPAAGPIGHVAAAVMGTVALGFLIPLAFAVSWGYPALVGNDFVAYFTAADMVVHGHGPQLYEADRQWAVQLPLLEAAGITPRGLITYVNPPLMGAVVAALYPFGLVLGGLLWVVTTLVAAAGVLALIARQPYSRPGWLRATLLMLSFIPFLEALYFGQMAAVMLVAFGGWFALSRANRPYLAGLALSVSLLKPQYAPVMLLFLAWKRQWSQLVGFAIGAVGHVLGTLLLLLVGSETPGLEALAPYFRFGGESNVVVDLQLNLRGAIWHLMPGADVMTQLAALALVTTLAIAGFLWAVGRTWEPSRPSFAWQTLALFAFVPITTYHNNLLHLYLLLTPAVALLVSPALERNGASWHRSALAGLLALPSLGIILGLALSPYFYYATGWVVALGALGLGLIALRQRRLLHEELADPQRTGALEPLVI